MGDISEAIIRGEICDTCCKPIDGDSPGYPRQCEDCQPKSKKQRLKEAAEEQRMAIELANKHGLTLKRRENIIGNLGTVIGGL